MKIAITGGIGSGKSYVCKLLGEFGIVVYDCDAAAKRLMRYDEQLKSGLQALLGNDVYDERGVLNKSVLAQFLLASDENRQSVNDIVHPAVARDFEQSGCSWLESAILFDSRFVERTHFDYIICVSAPEEVRLERVMKRDAIDRGKAQQWIDNQMSQDRVEKLSDYVIINDGKKDLKEQITLLLKNIKWKQF
jgi:dephospho-CoA kinase